MDNQLAPIVLFVYNRPWHTKQTIEALQKNELVNESELFIYCDNAKNDNARESVAEVRNFVDKIDGFKKVTVIKREKNWGLTGFNNYGMPFIRYDTGDMGELLYRNGGTVKFKKILGRNQDYIISKDNQKIFLTALIFGQHLKAFKNIKQWQLLQDEVGKVIISIIKGNLYSNEDELDIINNFQSVADIDLNFKYVDNISLTKRGKHLFLIQNIGKHDES